MIRKRFLVTVMGLSGLSAVATSVGVGTGSWARDVLSALVPSILLLLMAALAVGMAPGGARDLFSPRTLSSVFYVAYTIIPIVWYAWRGPTGYLSPSDFANVHKGAWLLFLGLGALIAGYVSPLGRFLGFAVPKRRFQVERKDTLRRVGVCIFIVAVCFRLYDLSSAYATRSVANAFVSISNMSPPAAIMSIAARLASDASLFSLALVAYAVWNKSQRPSSAARHMPIALVATMTVIAIVVGLLEGWKGNIITIGITVGCVYWFSWRQVRLGTRKLVAIGVGLIVAMLLSFPMVDGYRNAMRVSNEALPTMSTVAEAVKSQFGELRTWQYVDRIARRVNGVEAPTLIMERVPGENPWLKGQTLRLILVGAIPHALLPARQSTSAGSLYAQQILGWDDDSQGAVTHVGELYWSFGFVGVLVGMAALGVFYRFVYEYSYERQGLGVYSVPAYAAIVPALVRMEGSVEASVVMAAQLMVEYWLLAAVITGLTAFASKLASLRIGVKRRALRGGERLIER